MRLYVRSMVNHKKTALSSNKKHLYKSNSYRFEKCNRTLFQNKKNIKALGNIILPKGVWYLYLLRIDLYCLIVCLQVNYTILFYIYSIYIHTEYIVVLTKIKNTLKLEHAFNFYCTTILKHYTMLCCMLHLYQRLQNTQTTILLLILINTLFFCKQKKQKRFIVIACLYLFIQVLPRLHYTEVKCNRGR